MNEWIHCRCRCRCKGRRRRRKTEWILNEWLNKWMHEWMKRVPLLATTVFFATCGESSHMLGSKLSHVICDGFFRNTLSLIVSKHQPTKVPTHQSTKAPTHQSEIRVSSEFHSWVQLEWNSRLSSCLYEWMNAWMNEWMNEWFAEAYAGGDADAHAAGLNEYWMNERNVYSMIE